MDARILEVGGLDITVERAAELVRHYFDEAGSRKAASAVKGRPFAYPAYDRMVTGSGPGELNDGDLLAPLLLDARPTIAAVYSLQAVRPTLEAGLAAIPLDLTLRSAVHEGRGAHRTLIKGLFGVLDAPGGVRGVGLTTLTKVLHRKRPLFLPLFDRRVKVCYYGSGDKWPMRPVSGRTTAEFFTRLAECMVDDLDSRPDEWAAVAKEAPADVPLLRVLDVVAWTRGASA